MTRSLTVSKWSPKIYIQYIYKYLYIFLKNIYIYFTVIVPVIWFESRGECSLTVKISSGIFHPPSLPPHTHTHTPQTLHTHTFLKLCCARSLNFFITVTPGFLELAPGYLKFVLLISCRTRGGVLPGWINRLFSSSYLLDNPFLNCRPVQVSEPQSLTAKQVEEFSSTCTTFSTCICAVVHVLYKESL